MMALILAAAAIGPACAEPSAGTPDGGGITSGAGGGAGARGGDGGGTQTGGGGSAGTTGGTSGGAGASGGGGGGDAGGSGASGGGGAGARGGASGAGASGGASGAGAGGGRGGTGGASGAGGGAGARGGASGAAGGGRGGTGDGGAGGAAGGSAGAAGRGGTGGPSGGTGGGGGLPTVPDNGCNVRLGDTPIGFASLSGGTVGGGNTTPILVTAPDTLRTYLADNQPRVLYVMNDLDFRTANRTGVMVCADDTTCDNGSGRQVDNARVSATCDPGEHAATSYRYETRLTVASNKTVIGIGTGSGAAIRGASLNIGSSQQVVLRNLRIHDVNPHLVEAGDGITIQGAKHIWLDHLRVQEISDGYVDIGTTTTSTTIDDNITVSFVHFDGRTAWLCGGKHSYVNFADNAHVTYHHNWFDNGNGRNPKIGGANAQVHLFNNYWLAIGYFCITAQVDAQARVESNYFENASRPHWLQLDGSGRAGIAIDSGNVYTGASSGNTNRDTGGTVFSVPYAYTKETAATARTQIMKCAGPQPIR
jgi:pectate lyase